MFLKRKKSNFSHTHEHDLILNTELNDISYHQKDIEHMFVYDDLDSTVLSEFEMKDISSQEGQKLLGKFYHWLPMHISDIIDLYTYGNLNFNEIASIKGIDDDRVEKIFNAVKRQFRRHLE